MSTGPGYGAAPVAAAGPSATAFPPPAQVGAVPPGDISSDEAEDLADDQHDVVDAQQELAEASSESDRESTREDLEEAREDYEETYDEADD